MFAVKSHDTNGAPFVADHAWLAKRQAVLLGESVPLVAEAPGVEWSLSRAPEGSTATLDGRTLTPDLPGRYVLDATAHGARERQVEVIAFPKGALRWPPLFSPLGLSAAHAKSDRELRDVLRNLCNSEHHEAIVARLESPNHGGPTFGIHGIDLRAYGA